MSVDNVFIPKQGTLSDIAGWIAGDLGSALVRLYDNAHVFSPNDTPASYSEVSFAGYAPAGPVAWTAPVINGSGKAETDSPPLTWTFTAGVGTALVRGIFVTDVAKTKLLLVVPFNQVVTLTPAQPVLSRTLQVTEVSEL